jgi:excisionase family DNA binding protein
VSFHRLTARGLSTNVPGSPANHESFAAQVLPRFVSPKEAADRLGICRETIYRLCKKGRIPCLRVGSTLRLDLTDVLAALAREAS